MRRILTPLFLVVPVGLLGVAAESTSWPLGPLPTVVVTGAVVVGLVLSRREASRAAAEIEALRQQERTWMEQQEQATVGELEEALKRVALAGEQAMRGEAPQPAEAGTRRMPDSAMTAAVLRFEAQALFSLAQAARRQQTGQVVTLSRRLTTLTAQQVTAIDAVIEMVESPTTLKKVFGVDHLNERMRRLLRSIEVLGGGGAAPRRVSGPPVPVATVLRAATSGVAKFDKVRVVSQPQQALSLPGHAARDVVHVLAELLENATSFSDQDQEVTVCARLAPAGPLAVEIEDRGLGVRPAELLDLINSAVRADPAEALHGLIRQGRLGLYVVAVLARKHGLGLHLRPNLFGGTTALISVPQPLVLPAKRDTPAPAEPAAPLPSSTSPVAGPGASVPGPAPASAPAASTAAPSAPPGPLPDAVPEPAPDRQPPPALPRRASKARQPAEPAPSPAAAPAAAAPRTDLLAAWSQARQRRGLSGTTPDTTPSTKGDDQ